MARGKRRQQQRRRRRRRRRQARAANHQLQEVEEEGSTLQSVIAELRGMMHHALWMRGVSNCVDDDDDAAGSGVTGKQSIQSWESEAKNIQTRKPVCTIA
jgi:hypothetical protein